MDWPIPIVNGSSTGPSPSTRVPAASFCRTSVSAASLAATTGAKDKRRGSCWELSPTPRWSTETKIQPRRACQSAWAPRPGPGRSSVK